jgi:hypothetical protein
MSILALESDPLMQLLPAERPAYATGMLLDAQDFADEQAYHRGRLARALLFLAGSGTLAGLAVSHQPTTATRPDEEIEVAPGLALDRLGRLVEQPRKACLRLARWWVQMAAQDGGDVLRQARYDNLSRFASPRFVAAHSVELPAQAVVADLYIRFAASEVGYSPSFASGPYDALNAVAASRVRDAYELQLLPRIALDDGHLGLPGMPAAAGLADADATVRRDALQDTVLAAWTPPAAPSGNRPGVATGPEHEGEMDGSAVWLARVFLPVIADAVPTRALEAPVLIDNFARRFLPTLALLGRSAGL